ncbi:hypothetical protein LTR28_004744 [Elasticomyces elasticus]|nr:hypothetical protein LTR28_004744 [Elasticomyces elasticus]
MGLLTRHDGSGAAGPATGSAPSASTRTGHAVPLPRWTLGIRALQLALAIVILGLVCYVQHVYRDTYLQRSTIPTLLIAILTILPILPLATPLLRPLRQYYNPVAALAADLFATLFWLAAMAVLAAYTAVFDIEYLVYGYPDYSVVSGLRHGIASSVGEARERRGFESDRWGYRNGGGYGALKRLKRARRCGAVAAGFAGVEL